MFELLTRILLWVLIGSIIWYIFSRFINKTYLTWLGGLVVLTFILLAFLEPTDRTVGTVWSILSLPLKPLGLVIFLLLNALREGSKKVAGNQVVAALMVLFFASTPVVAYWLTSQTERAAFSTVAIEGERPADPSTVRAIAILGDGTGPTDPTYGARTQFSNMEGGFGTGMVSRLYYGAQLFREQAAQNNQPLVIVTAGPSNTDQDEGARRQSIVSLLVGSGVPEDRILVDFSGVDVRGSAVQVERLLVERGFRKDVDTVILVSPALNVRRASSAFAQLRLRTLPRPTDFFAFQLQPSGRRLAILADLIPNVEALALTTRAVDEYLTSVYYFLRGWLLNPMLF